MFQFLIGSLKTEEGNYVVDETNPEFQFLIGSLKTQVLPVTVLSLLEFQFLIGSLKTD